MNRRITLLAAGLAMLAGGGLELAAQPAQPAKPAADSKAEDGASEADDSLYDCKKARGRFKVTLRPDTELKDLIGWAMTFSCRNFVYNPAIGGRAAKVTVMSPQSVTAGQAWRVFLTALQSMNLTIVPKGTVLEIVEQPQAKTQALPIYLRGRPPASDQVVRAVIRPQHLGVNDLAQILQSLKSKDGEVKPQEKIGVIVVTDFGSHIAKMGALVTAVDSPVSGERLYMIKVKHADATELATKLSEILGTAEGGGASAPPAPAPRGRRARAAAARAKAQADANIPDSPDEAYRALPSKIIADDRLNALILLSSRAAYLRVKALVERLDVALDFDSGGKIHVYTLEHADAEEMAQTLTSVISGIQQPTGGANNQPGRPRRPAPAPAAAGTASDAAAFEGQVRVTHDKPTNSLVAVASAADFIALRRIIRQLDTPRRQVYLEATIVEVSVDNSLDLGVSFHGGVEQDGSIILGGVQHNELSSLNVATLASATGLIGGILGPLLDNAEEFLGTSIPSFGVLFQALATSGNVHVLSSPHILTTDNEEAEISVGQNIPYQSAIGFGGIGTPGQGGGGLFPTQSVQRQDVALTLKITPQINASDVIRLQIDLEISDIASENFGGLGPSWAKRTIKDVVVVRDQQAVVIGGLMNDRTSTSESKVPLLGDIPVLGYLFKYKSTSKEKRNLLVMLTPYVVKDQLDIERIVERRVREQREFMRTFSTFRSMKYRPDVDYRRKRGLLEEINRAALQVERETLELEELERRQILFPDGPIEEFPADEGEETEGEDEAETPGPAEGDTGGSRP
jgi:general secretion pathway protein D